MRLDGARAPLLAAGLLQLGLTTVVLWQALRWLFVFPWEHVSSGPGAIVVHAMSLGVAMVAGALVLAAVGLLRGRQWAWRVSWVAVRLAAVVLVVLPLIGILEAPHGAKLVEPLRMLAWSGPALLLAALLSAARGSLLDR